jgi:hypothetical protein
VSVREGEGVGEGVGVGVYELVGVALCVGGSGEALGEGAEAVVQGVRVALCVPSPHALSNSGLR